MALKEFVPVVYVDDQDPPMDADNMNNNEQQTKLLTDAVIEIQTSLESSQYKQALDQVKQLAEDAAKSAEWASVSGKPTLLTIGTTATTAMAGDTALLKIGTTASTAKAGNAVQTAAQTTITAIDGVDGADVQAALASLAAQVKALQAP